MAVVIFTDLWLNPVGDLMHGMAICAHSIEHDPTVSVDVRPYAGGNFRMVTTPGRQRSVKVAASFCTDIQVAQLKTWQGVLLCLRDPRGEKVYGAFTDPAFTPRNLPDSWQVTFSFTEVTVTEEV